MRSRTVVLAAALVVSSAVAIAAQECVGIPKGGKGLFAVGLAGTDGASGSSLSLAVQSPKHSLSFEQQSLGVFAHANPQRTSTMRTSFLVKRLHGCLTAGAGFQTWNTEGSESTGWSIDDPGVYVERHSVGGDYSRLRIPVGLSFGRTFAIKGISATPFVNPFVAYEAEHFRPDRHLGMESTHRTSIGGGLATGFALRAGSFMARPTISVMNTRDRALSGKKNFAEFALHLGVIF